MTKHNQTDKSITRVTISLPTSLKKDIDAFAGTGKFSAFIASYMQEAIRKEKAKNFVKFVKDFPKFKLDKPSEEIIREIRDTQNRKDMGLE